jgi:4-hydroxy-tetrahydrodipicolinate reductase
MAMSLFITRASSLLPLLMLSTILHVNGFTLSIHGRLRWPSHLSSALRLSSSASDDDTDIYVMVNGMPGPMATAAAEACLRQGLKLAPVAMTGPEVDPMTIVVYDPVSEKSSEVKLIPSTEREEIAASIQGLKEACGEKNLLAIDYTHPSAVNANGEFYLEQKLPFVMGTTGGDRERLVDSVNAASHFAVIAPNMGKQIVAMQAALEDLAKKYPSAFASYTLACKESHQKTKADTSGTAKAVIDSLKELSDDDFTYEDIEMIRNDEQAIQFGVPEDALKGHAFHRYTLTSADGTTQFALEHNVAGRTIYAEGTADAVKFLAKRVKEDAEGKVYTMINVLEAGALG